MIDAKTYAVKQYILVGQRPWHMALDPDGSKLYPPVGHLPWGVAVMPYWMSLRSVPSTLYLAAAAMPCAPFPGKRC